MKDIFVIMLFVFFFLFFFKQQTPMHQPIASFYFVFYMMKMVRRGAQQNSIKATTTKANQPKHKRMYKSHKWKDRIIRWVGFWGKVQ